jgi:hypothetical protein
MNTKTENKNQGQKTTNPSQDKNKQQGSNQQGKKTGFKEGMDNEGGVNDVENNSDQKQDPEIDTPVQQPEKTEKKIPNMKSGL